MTLQATVGGAVLGTSLGAGVARVSAASVGGTRFSAASAGERAAGSGRVVAQASQELAMTGASNIVLILTLALMVLALGLLLNGLGRRHAAFGLAGPHPGQPSLA